MVHLHKKAHPRRHLALPEGHPPLHPRRTPLTLTTLKQIPGTVQPGERQPIKALTRGAVHGVPPPTKNLAEDD